MATQTFYRKATVSRADATASLFKRFPNADLVSFEQKTATADEAALAGATEGETIYAATIRVAEFPPSDDESGSDDSGSEESAPKKEKSEGESSDSGSSDDSGDSSDSDSGDSEGGDKGAPFGGGEGGDEPGKPKKMSPDEQIVHLLSQILDALKGGAAPGGPAGAPDPLGAPDLPDIGAPGQGESLPPAGPAGHGAPLPPPVKQKSPVGVGAFSHVADRAEVSFVRSDASEIGNKALIAEAAEVMPTHRVAKIQRTGTADINGQTVNLPERNIAVVTLVRK